MAAKSGGTADTTKKGGKGRPTPRRNAPPPRSGLPPRLQWILVILAVVVVLAVIIWIGRDWRSTTGAPAVDPVVVQQPVSVEPFG